MAKLCWLPEEASPATFKGRGYGLHARSTQCRWRANSKAETKKKDATNDQIRMPGASFCEGRGFILDQFWIFWQILSPKPSSDTSEAALERPKCSKIVSPPPRLGIEWKKYCQQFAKTHPNQVRTEKFNLKNGCIKLLKIESKKIVHLGENNEAKKTPSRFDTMGTQATGLSQT